MPQHASQSSQAAQSETVRPQTDQEYHCKIINTTVVNWAAPFVPQPVTMLHKKPSSALSLCFTARLTPGTAGNSCRAELSGKRKAEQRAMWTHKMRWGAKAHATGETQQLQIPLGLSWPCLDWAITSKAGSDPASLSGKTPSHISSSGLNSWRLWTLQVHSHVCKILNACHNLQFVKQRKCWSLYAKAQFSCRKTWGIKRI